MEKSSQRFTENFIERYVHFESLIYEKKKLVMDVSLASDIESLGHMLSDVSERDRLHRDFTLDSLSTVVRELIACFPVYRTYISRGGRRFRGGPPGHPSRRARRKTAQCSDRHLYFRFSAGYPSPGKIGLIPTARLAGCSWSLF